jgi:glutamyl-tRNA synthetase
MDGFESRSDTENEDIFRAAAEELGIKLGQLLMPLRVAVTGSTVSPPLFESLMLLGKEKILTRIDRARALLKQ